MIPLLWERVEIGQHSKPVLQVLEVRPKNQPDAEPFARMLMQRAARIERDAEGKVYRASITIHYEEISPESNWGAERGKGSFCGSFDSFQNRVSLSSAISYRGAVFLDPAHWRGHHLGTYFMNEIVQWVKQWPDASVTPVELLEGQAEDSNRERRNRFYEQFGLVFDYQDADHRKGFSRDMRAANLRTVDTGKANIRELGVLEWMDQRLKVEALRGFELEDLKRALLSRRETMNGIEKHPLRWALKMLYYRYIPVLQLVLAAGLVVAIWWKWVS